ncbi:TylF/MycF/NovP-related O-methyltransferase [Actinoplanes sp. DH11]|uniref:TylF/MycF/NovP-related O-methyltransferase n=1 Tax=Actinoplanes sp. DH11 TaxID=2857011 RepID=UPI001E576612|nr:TylF/MycF/NovP-related O-methyltransferase [Actinoplanes sp. DH11]
MSAPDRPVAAPGGLSTEAERRVPGRIAEIFQSSPDDLPTRLANMFRYARRAQVTRFAALYELVKLALPVKGSIVECGVFRGSSFMTFAQLSAALEPTNLTRRVYGFDSFGGFPAVSGRDLPETTEVRAGDLASDSYDELNRLLEVYDTDRFLGHLPKARLIRGDVTETIPAFVAENPHLVISLLFLDLDLYEPTRVALRHLLPRLPRGAVLAFDELDNPLWPGETSAVLDEVGLNSLELRRFDFDPYIGYAVIR